MYTISLRNSKRFAVAAIAARQQAEQEVRQ